MKTNEKKQHMRFRAEISLDAVEENYRVMREGLPENVRMAAVIKADAYGHGAVTFARFLAQKDYIWGFAVATAQEAVEIADLETGKPVLILGHVFAEDLEDLIRREVRLTISTMRQAQEADQAAALCGKKAFLHFALDTGMSRIGFSDTKESVEEIVRIAKLGNIVPEGLFTHFARADEPDLTPAREQLSRYNRFSGMLKDAGVEICLHHVSNSAGILRFFVPGAAADPEKGADSPSLGMPVPCDFVRAGISMYGIYPSGDVEWHKRLSPVMRLVSHVSHVKTISPGTAVSYGGTFTAQSPTRVATIPVGYADGYPRSLSGKGYVLIHGQKAPILGRVCMDQFMVDVTHIPEVLPGDPVILLGRDGDAVLSVETLSELSGRFPYEFVCDIGKRVPRVIMEGNEI